MKDSSVELETPVVSVKKLICSFEQVLEKSNVSKLISLPVSRASFPKPTQLSLLAYKYENLLEIVTDIVVEIEDEPMFTQIKFPELPQIGHDNKDDIVAFVNYVFVVRNAIQPLVDDELAFNKKKEFLKKIADKKKVLDKGFFYEFTEGDLDRIQQLINELRKQITDSELFEDSHRARLLRRLEMLQAEMHKKMGDIDKIWGLVGDAGIVIGKFGKDSKPFVDRIKELAQIGWNTQARREELPSNVNNPLLGSNEDIGE